MARKIDDSARRLLFSDNGLFEKSETLYNGIVSEASDNESEWKKSHETNGDLEDKR